MVYNEIIHFRSDLNHKLNTPNLKAKIRKCLFSIENKNKKQLINSNAKLI